MDGWVDEWMNKHTHTEFWREFGQMVNALVLYGIKHFLPIHWDSIVCISQLKTSKSFEEEGEKDHGRRWVGRSRQLEVGGDRGSKHRQSRCWGKLVKQLGRWPQSVCSEPGLNRSACRFQVVPQKEQLDPASSSREFLVANTAARIYVCAPRSRVFHCLKSSLYRPKICPSPCSQVYLGSPL
jgi:hypothetical protein